jgi:hypothetical protein
MENQQQISTAIQLYEVLGKYIPSRMDFHDDYLAFASKIVSNLKEGNPEDYFTSIQIMTGVSQNVLENSESVDVFDLFIHALIEWRIIELVEFFREIGYQNG